MTSARGGEAPASAGLKRRRGALHCAIALGAFIAGCLVLHRIAPWPRMDEISEKLAYFARHRDEFDTLFIGSSRIYHGIAPQLFDATLKTHGFASTSLNLGIDGMSMPESACFLEKILEQKPARLKWVFVELTSFRLDMDENRRESARGVYWHDWTRMKWIACELWHNGRKTGRGYQWASKRLRPVLNDLEAGAVHASLFLRNIGNVGRGYDLADGAAPTNSEQFCGAPKFGFLGMDRAEPMTGEELKGYEKKLAEMRVRKADPGDNGWGLRVVTDHASRLIRAAGAEPVFVITSSAGVSRHKWPGQPTDALLFAYHDPDRNEKFYRVDRRANSGHLNTLGALEFTELLASDFAKHLSEQRPHAVR